MSSNADGGFADSTGETLIDVDRIKIGNRFRKDVGNLDSLADSIERLGLLQPIGVDPEYRLIWGDRRLKVFQRLGLVRIPARIVELSSLLQAEHDENEVREQFKPSERVAIGKAIEAELGNRRGQRTDLELGQNFAEVKGKRTSEIAAHKAGFGNKETFRQASKVVETGVPELVAAMDQGTISISTAAKLSQQDPEIQEQAASEPERAVEISKSTHNHRAQGTGENEWYTPQEILEVARTFLDGFDLDPASSEIANKAVRADRYFSQYENGLKQNWFGKVWLNPPYSQPDIRLFVEKIVFEYSLGNVLEAILLTHNYTDTGWFHHAMQGASAICFTRGRIGFLNPEGKKAAPTQGQTFFYYGSRSVDFSASFAGIGRTLFCE